ncbi:MAG: hypothetical protein EA412_01035 [Chitinophagaceae bacterium]|nr:MAG: hypothetical protein EA412_01035 [Chitinophagaceae bacterium]
MKLIIEHLHKAFNLTFELADVIRSEDLKLKLKDLPSNTIGDQFYCIIGARESYLKAIVNNGWMGFSCSLDDTTSKDKVLKCLNNSAKDSMDFVNKTDLNENQLDLLLNLLEHEIQHHGQLIRFFYGNKLSFPQSWTERYTV